MVCLVAGRMGRIENKREKIRLCAVFFFFLLIYLFIRMRAMLPFFFLYYSHTKEQNPHNNIKVFYFLRAHILLF